MTQPARLPGAGWLALVGGGEFSFGETEDADGAWLDRSEEGPIGFVPAASGSEEYPKHFAAYLRDAFAREVETIPIYRPRDARRGRNAERIAACPAVYLGGGVADHLLDALADSPALVALGEKLRGGGMVVAISAAAQACGSMVRSIVGGRPIPGLGWLPGGVVEASFELEHDRRLRTLLRVEGVTWGVGIPAGGALLLGPAGEVETIGPVYCLGAADAEYTLLGFEES